MRYASRTPAPAAARSAGPVRAATRRHRSNSRVPPTGSTVAPPAVVTAVVVTAAAAASPSPLPVPQSAMIRTAPGTYSRCRT
ncbi:MAG TPA: hypothetical protein VFY14_15780, partial [Streptomyces sp.]|nr:hypothetical protein [Streptomyces sp.]